MLHRLQHLLHRVVAKGRLTIIDARGRTHLFGDGSGPPVTVRLTDRGVEWELALDPGLAIGEAYMDGRLVPVEGSIYDFVAMMMSNLGIASPPRSAALLDLGRRAGRMMSQFNPAVRSRRNVAHHYDIDPRIYDLFLDPARQYSCAYFSADGDLDAAQRAKMRHIAAKLALGPGQRVLDIGCGWGGLAVFLATATGCEVTGVTLSTEQLAGAQQRARQHGLSRRVSFRLEDYRATPGRFDRIVSVGMFEHVGVGYYATFFRRIAELLAEDGVALLHTIGRSDGPGFTNPFIAKYIFPGGYFPALSEVLPVIERAGLIVCDVEVLRLHYAETLQAWRERFLARRAEAVAIKSEAFARMWEFYLAASEAAFRYQGLVVFQVQLAKRIDALPITRDYIERAERRLDVDRIAAAPTRMAGE